MGFTSESDVNISMKPVCPAYSYFVFIRTMFKDVLFYAILIPLVGTYLSGILAKRVELTPTLEVVFNVFLTFFVVYAAIALFTEPCFWRQLFAFQSLHYSILRIRDGVNTIILVITLVYLAIIIEEMVDGSIKPEGEGLDYYFLNIKMDAGNDEDNDNTFQPNLRPASEKNGRYAHGGVYMFYWAVLASCVAKLVYFNVLFTYLRAMNIFVSLNPSFDDDDEYEPVEQIDC